MEDMVPEKQYEYLSALLTPLCQQVNESETFCLKASLLYGELRIIMAVLTFVIFMPITLLCIFSVKVST